MGTKSNDTVDHDLREVGNIANFGTAADYAHLTLRVLPGIAGVLATVSFIFAAAFFKKLRSSANVFVANLLVANSLVVAILVVSGATLRMTASSQWYLYCKWIGPAATATFASSLYSFAAIACNRCVLICCNTQQYHRWYRFRQTMLNLAAIWLLGVLIATPPIFGFGDFFYNIKIPQCTIDVDGPGNLAYSLLLVILSFIPSAVVSSVAFWKIVDVVRRSRRVLASTSPGILSNAACSTLADADRSGGHRFAAESVGGDATNRPSFLSGQNVSDGLPFDGDTRLRRIRKEWALTSRLVVFEAFSAISWIPYMTVSWVDMTGNVQGELWAAMSARASTACGATRHLLNAINP